MGNILERRRVLLQINKLDWFSFTNHYLLHIALKWLSFALRQMFN